MHLKHKKEELFEHQFKAFQNAGLIAEAQRVEHYERHVREGIRFLLVFSWFPRFFPILL